MKPVYYLAGGLALALVVITAAVILGAVGDDVGGARLVAWAAPFVAALLLGGGVQAATGKQNSQILESQHQLATITQQTNGTLDARIAAGAEAAIRSVISDLGVVGPVTGPPRVPGTLSRATDTPPPATSPPDDPPAAGLDYSDRGGAPLPTPTG